MISIDLNFDWQFGGTYWLLDANAMCAGGCLQNNDKTWYAYSNLMCKGADFKTADDAKAWVERWLKRYCKKHKLTARRDGCTCYQPKPT